jgi:hypothetical protein
MATGFTGKVALMTGAAFGMGLAATANTSFPKTGVMPVGQWVGEMAAEG